MTAQKFRKKPVVIEDVLTRTGRAMGSNQSHRACDHEMEDRNE